MINYIIMDDIYRRSLKSPVNIAVEFLRCVVTLQLELLGAVYPPF